MNSPDSSDRSICLAVICACSLIVISAATGRLAAQDSFEGQFAGQEMTQRPWLGTYCWCPPGKFKMGDEVRRDALPTVEVELTHGFWIGKYEVTQAQYEFVMGNNPSHFKGAYLPVESVTWAEADEFCKKLTELARKRNRLPMGWKYGLPTEAQWEYASRAGASTRYPWGNEASKLGEYAWYLRNSGTEEGLQRLKQMDRAALAKLSVDESLALSGRRSHPVGQKKSNAWGLCDMPGNVNEWCRDWFQRELPGGTDPEGNEETARRTIRGGSWCWSERPLRSTFPRLGGRPDGRGNNCGFRVVAVPTN